MHYLFSWNQKTAVNYWFFFSIIYFIYGSFFTMAVQLHPSFDGWFVFQQFMAGQNNQIVMNAIMFKCLEECTNHLSIYNLSVLYFLCLFKDCGRVCSKKVVESFQWNLSFKEALLIWSNWYKMHNLLLFLNLCPCEQVVFVISVCFSSVWV